MNPLMNPDIAFILIIGIVFVGVLLGLTVGTGNGSTRVKSPGKVLEIKIVRGNKP